MDIRTDRLGLLLGQLESSCQISKERLAGLTDEEYLWEPAPGCWSLRQRAGGDWRLDYVRPEPVPAPVTTIAWRLGHLYTGFSLRWEWTFGGRRKLEEGVALTPLASEAVDRFWALMDRWRESVGAMTDDQLDMVGFGQYPRGLDPHLPFIAIVWLTNREFIHHMAEIGVLRDLWSARAGASANAGR